MIPLSSLPGGAGGLGRPGAGQQGMGGGGGMIPLGSLNKMPPGGGAASSSAPPSMAPPPGGPPQMAPPQMAPPGGAPPNMMPPPGAPPPGSMGGEGMMPNQQQQFQQTPAADGSGDTLAEVGKVAKDYLDVLMPISVPSSGEDSRPVPKQVQCLEDGTDLFKMFEVDFFKFDIRAVKKKYHQMAVFVDPAKLGREPSASDKARFTKLKQAYTVIGDEQLRAVYRQYCFGIAGSGGCPAQGHEAALAKALEMGRELRKMGEERAIVLHKAAETGWTVAQKDDDGRSTFQDKRQAAHAFNLFGDISSSDNDDGMLEKERRGLTTEQIIEMSPKYADSFLDRVKPLLMDPKVSKSAAGGAFTMSDDPKLLELLNESPKTVQKILRKVRTSLKQMNWAMTSLLQNKDSPWRGLEVKASLAEAQNQKLLEIIKSGIAMGKFSEVHEEDFSKLLDSLHRLYMDIFEKRGQELLRAAVKAELQVVYLLPESGGRLPDGSRVILQDLVSRNDLNGKKGVICGWDYMLQRYNIELDKEEKKKKESLENPDLLGVGDMEDADEQEEEENAIVLEIPKKIMLQPKNTLVDLDVPRGKLESLVKNWNAWRRRPRSVSASQDAEAVAAALGPPLESMAGYLGEAASAVSTGAACGKDGADLIAFECREALQGARNLAAKLLGEEPEEPPPPPPLNEPPPAIVPVKGSDDPVSQVLKEAAEVAAAGLGLHQEKRDQKKKKSRSRSRKRRKKRSSSSSDERQKKR